MSDGDVLEMPMPEARLTRTLLIDMGNKFKVLIQRKGLPEVQLSGLKRLANS